jgi:alkanesulfonate monooxygenase SsuD/methylene tetrahydromethanopterin reductase-like flavin-dependent oxidoreductase (luciferase family)
MAQPLQLASAGRPPARRSFAPRSDEFRQAAKRRPSDQDLALLTRVNLLVVGHENEAVALIASLWPSLVTPIVVRHRGEPLRLSTIPPAGTFVIYDVESLTRAEQDALHQWLNSGIGHAQVVSSASGALFAMVEAGVFNDALYYRLNVVTIDLTSPVP